MVQAGIGGLDTPRTNLGDATYLSHQQLDFDISQEQSFQSPSKDNNNLVQQLQNGRRGAFRTPRSRVALADRRNVPGGLGGGEFTPLLKSATRNSSLRNGKENIQTPGFLRPGGLDNIPEDLSPLPLMQNSSAFGDSRNGSFMPGTPMPQMDTSSAASTPMALLPRRNEGPGVLQDGNQLSLREQENVIDKIEKENFGLKLKIHFLEEALRKAGPGFSEAALKENTELKVDKVTMQKELYRYRKTLTAAERDVELYRQQLIEMQDKMKRKHNDEGQREELDRLRQALEEREADLSRLRTQEGRFEDLEDKIHDLEVESREKERIINDHEDEAENMKEEADKQNDIIADLKDSLKQAQRRIVELEEEGSPLSELEEAKENIQELERLADRLRNDVEDAKEDRQEAMREKERAESNLEELQDEMANKSITTKGLSRQIEEKANRLHDELEDLREKHAELGERYENQSRDMQTLREEVEVLKQQHEAEVQTIQDQLEAVQKEKDAIARAQRSLSQQLDAAEQERQQALEEKQLLQLRHDSLTNESSSLQRDLKVLEDKLEHERAARQRNELETGSQHKEEIQRLNDENEDLRADVREKERVYDDDSDKWENERRKAESQLNMAEERATALQRSVDRLQQVDGTLSTKETQVQQALQDEKSRHEDQEASLSRQIKELNDDIESKQKSLELMRSELMSVKEELRLSAREQKSLSEKVEGLEDEVEILQTSLDDESDQANRELSASRQETEALRKEIQSLRQDIAHVDSAAKNFQDNSRGGQGSEEQLSSRIRDIETQLSKVRQEKQTLQDQLAAINIELFALRVSKTEVQAERDEIQSQLKAMKQQEDETFRLDQERIDLRATKMKLDNEIRRLRDENNAAITRTQTAENELEREILRASSEESRMSTEIQDLQKLIRNSSEKRELATAKKTIQQLETRIQQLEDRLSTSNDHGAAVHELSFLRHDLSAARQKETDFLQREAAQKDILRNHKRQVMEMERKAHDAEVSRFISPSPRSSPSGSARKSEVVEVRTQLATVHQTLKELRAQLKDAEKDANRKVNAANVELQARTAAWELEKDKLEHSLDEADFKKEELQARNAASEATVARLRGKIERLEKSLQAERLNNGEDRTIVQERRDLHEMLRETQLQAESLELVIEERDKTIAAISAAESELRGQVKRIREERSTQKSKAASSQQQLASLEAKFKKAREAWDTERRGLCKGVRFVNQSLSVNDASQAIVALRREFHEKEHYHVKEMRGMAMQVEWLRARCKREEFFRFEAAFAKKYMALQIACFEACNRADIALLESSGVPRPVRKPKKKTFRVFLHIVRATVRMSRGVEAWREKRKIGDRLSEKMREQRAEGKLLLQQQQHHHQQRMITSGR